MRASRMRAAPPSREKADRRHHRHRRAPDRCQHGPVFAQQLQNPKANAAHFLIDKDGTIYQTAAIYQRTNHVGPLKARCLLVGKCRAKDYEGAGVKGMHRIEMMKAPGDRYPSNMEAIGIEMVGRAVLPKGFKPLSDERN